MSEELFAEADWKLLKEKAITLEDLEGFSDNLRERLKFLFRPRNKKTPSVFEIHDGADL